VVAKAEHIDGKENPRFVVTSLNSTQWTAQALYEDLYCARGEMENRIKEQFSLFADRVSTETMRANQLRLYLSAMAYILMSGLRRLGLKATELAQAQVSTIRTKLLKIGAQIRITVRRVWSRWLRVIPGRAFISRSGSICAADGIILRFRSTYQAVALKRVYRRHGFPSPWSCSPQSSSPPHWALPIARCRRRKGSGVAASRRRPRCAVRLRRRTGSLIPLKTTADPGRSI
jgi:hypothetical protein